MLELAYKQGVIAKEDFAFSRGGFSAIYEERRLSANGLGFIPHMHSVFEILYVENGSAEILCNDGKFIAETGNIFVFNCDELHSCFFARKDYFGKWIQFDFNLMASKFIDTCEMNFIAPIFNHIITFKNYHRSDSELTALFKKMEREFKEKPAAYEISVKGLLYEFLAQLTRAAVSRNLLDDNAVNSVNLERVNYVIKYITENFSEKISLADLTKELFINEAYLCRIFKSFTGKSIIEYLNMYRVLRATTLLTETTDSIADISNKAGFDDVNYFSRIFKKYTGLTPREVRQNHKPEISV